MQEQRRRLVGVVDDDQAVRESLCLLLETAGYHAIPFESADRLLAATEFDALDCVVLDHHMPRGTGLELLRHLYQAGRRVPIALMTGSPSPQLTQQALALGAVTVLEKPLAEAALFGFLGQSAP